MAAIEAGLLRIRPDGVEVTVRVQPEASRESVGGTMDVAGGRKALTARVRAPAEGGKANAALIRLLAKRLRVAKSDIEIRSGQSGRLKTLVIRGEAVHLSTAVETLLSGA